jgi:hypothetical protein
LTIDNSKLTPTIAISHHTIVIEMVECISVSREIPSISMLGMPISRRLPTQVPKL